MKEFILPACALMVFGSVWALKSGAVGSSHQPPATAAAASDMVRPLGLRKGLPDAASLLDCEEHNPHRESLSNVELTELQAIIDQVNHDLEGLQGGMNEIASNWAELRVSNGNFDYVIPGESTRPPKGTIVVRITDRDAVKDVFIHPGECAQLDARMADIDRLLLDGKQTIDSFMKHRSKGGKQ